MIEHSKFSEFILAQEKQLYTVCFQINMLTFMIIKLDTNNLAAISIPSLSSSLYSTQDLKLENREFDIIITPSLLDLKNEREENGSNQMKR
ncbi:Olfactory Receptor 10A5 [Manis pentadactyla]|nr:Olfactory Receptor 10A5 [Manis pentadactyla]